jgi:beta-lactam-binding protein with PASTA domain
MKERILNSLVDLRLFLTSKIFLKNFGGMLAVVVGTLILIFLFLRLFTRHNSHITIPSYIGKTVEQATNLKASRHIEIIVVDSSAYDETMEPGEIVAQDPSPEAQAKKGRNVYVTINPYEAPLVPVPRLWDLQLNMAEAKLRRGKFKWKITRKPDRAVNTILEVKINRGKRMSVVKPFNDPSDAPRVPQGTELELVVAEGSGVELQTPYLTCLTYSEAMQIIKSNNLSSGSLTVLGNVIDTTTAYVFRQYPTPYGGKPIKTGDPIDLWLQADKPFECDDTNTDEEDDNMFE